MNVFQIVTDRIIKQLSEGVIPWHKPWSGVRGGAYSHVTGKPYSLLNQMLAQKPGEYLTFKQCTEEGGKIKKGEKSSIIVFYKQLELVKDDGTKETSRIPHLVYYNVFHIDQCEGIDPKYTPETLPTFVPDEEADRIASDYVTRSGCGIRHVKQSKAFYNPTLDIITMPLREQFHTPPGYYSVLFHEIGHSTGHETRLNRQIKNTFADEKYSREELIAELTAAAMLNTLGMETQATVKSTSAYIQRWLTALKNDKQMIVWAASRTEKALQWIMNEASIALPVSEPVKPVPILPAERPATASVAMRKAAVSFAAECEKRFKKVGQGVAGAFAVNGKQYITDGHVAVAYDTPFEGLVATNTKGVDLGNVENVFQSARVGLLQILPQLEDMRTQCKKAKGKSRTFFQMTYPGDAY